MSAKFTELNENDSTRVEALLLGRRIVAADEGTYDFGGYEKASGRLTLDNGQHVYVVPNQGGCSCGAGDYELTHLASVDNIITSVRLDTETSKTEDGYDEETHYQIFVVADAVEINMLTIEGDDGNGYYGTGYRLYVDLPLGAGHD